METHPQVPQFTIENWQTLAMETAEYERPASDNLLISLSQKLVLESLELVNPTTAEIQNSQRYGRASILSLEGTFSQHSDQLPTGEELDRAKKHVADEFGDVLWYQTALLVESGIDMQDVVKSVLHKIDSNTDDPNPSLDDLNNRASLKEPAIHPQGTTLSSNPFVIYGGWYVSQFVRAISPEYARADTTKEQKIDAAADMLWMTIYIINNYCDVDLNSVLQSNYTKLQARALAGRPQGIGSGDDSWRE